MFNSKAVPLTEFYLPLKFFSKKIDYANFLAQSQKNDHFSERSYNIDTYTIRFLSSRRTFLMS